MTRDYVFVVLDAPGWLLLVAASLLGLGLIRKLWMQATAARRIAEMVDRMADMVETSADVCERGGLTGPAAEFRSQGADFREQSRQWRRHAWPLRHRAKTAQPHQETP